MTDADILAECRGRARIAADLFGWSTRRLADYDAALAEAILLAPEALEREMRSLCGLPAEVAASPGPESGWSRAEHAGLVRLQACGAIRSFRQPAWVPGDPAAYARGYADCEVFTPAEASAGGVAMEPDLEIGPLAELYDIPVRDWLRRENAWAMEDGRTGYEDLVLEQIAEPCVLGRRDGRLDIADGWHRTAALLVTGHARAAAVVVSCGPREEPDEPGFS